MSAATSNIIQASNPPAAARAIIGPTSAVIAAARQRRQRMRRRRGVSVIVESADDDNDEEEEEEGADDTAGDAPDEEPIASTPATPSNEATNNLLMESTTCADSTAYSEETTFDADGNVAPVHAAEPVAVLELATASTETLPNTDVGTDADAGAAIRCIFLCEFHATAGPRITAQVPAGHISKELFDTVSRYIIPKLQLQRSFLSV